jgi:hypothetical protein
MKFSAVAVLAAAAGASAGHVSNVTYTTEVVTAYTTYCPGPTEITHGGKTYTVTKATTLTITDCPCTITKPVITTSAVVCHHCSAPGYTNSTLINVPTQGKPEEPKPTGSKPATSKGQTPTQVPVAGAGKVALSGAGLAGVVGLAAFFL